jgi:transposase
MKKGIKTEGQQDNKTRGKYPEGCTVGLDIGDEYTHAAVLNSDGAMLMEERMRTREPEMRKWLSSGPAALVALETGTHSRWIAQVARQCGHEVIVANARELRLIYGGTNKHDRMDARKLARMARVDPELLKPVKLRGERQQSDLAMIGARELLVNMRSKAINMVRGTVKAAGTRVEACGSGSFPQYAAEVMPEDLKNALAPVLELLDELNNRILEYDERIEHLAEERYPEVKLLTQVHGVGTLTALMFMLTIGDPWRFQRSRDVGCYLGLRPKRNQSGDRDPQLGISKAGNSRLRKTLVNCAHVILGRFGADCDLRRWGLKLAGTGRNTKKRAIVAVARKLAVLLHVLWTTGEEYRPLREVNVAAEVAA